jgi:hypothetical protein
MQAETEVIYDFVAIGELADTMRQFIQLGLTYNIRRQEQPGGMEQVTQYVVQRSRDYVGRVREGFVLSVRTVDVTSRDELAYLVERVLLNWADLEAELGLAGESSPELEPQPLASVRDQLLAFGMAAVALGMLPRLPQEQVTFPKSLRKPATYADIPVPTSPAAMLQRIEEIETTVWQLASYDLPDLAERHYAPLRRTYGFFESSAWLARLESERFGLKPSAGGLVQ